MSKEKLKEGGLYVIRYRNERNVDLLRELKKHEVIALNLNYYIPLALKSLAVIASVLFPPLLLLTIPLLLMRGKS